MAFPQSFLEELRARVSIVDVVGRHVTWRKEKSNFARGDYWACCPFHNEKTPSFHAVESRGIYHCFGCHESGSAIDFLMKIERLSFPEAVERLAADAGLKLPEKDPRMAAREAKQKSLTEATDAAVRLFREELFGPRGADALSYLSGRGVSMAMIEKFEIGLAPRRGDDALSALKAQGFSIEQLLAADLARPSQDGGRPYHPFSGRLMFPIRDTRGRCVAFGGRALEPGARAKYLNSRETELFSKSKLLYNLGPARAAARDAPLIVAEGYMDVIALAQAGFESAVAPLGTALTEDQLALLWKVAPEPRLALDGDRAGLDAARRAAELALPKLGPDRSLAFILMPEGQDPDDLIKEKGASAMKAAIDDAAPLIELLWRRERDAAPLDTPERKAGLEARLTDLSNRIEDETVRKNYFFDFKRRIREHFADEAAARRMSKSAQNAGAARFGKGAARFAPAAGPTDATKSNALALAQQKPAARRLREAAILRFALQHPDAVARCESDWSAMELTDPTFEKIRHALLEVFCLTSSYNESGEQDDAASTAGAANDAIAKRISSDELETIMKLGASRAPKASAMTADEIDDALRQMISLQIAAVSWSREIESYSLEIESGEDESEPVRLRQAQIAAIPRRSGGGDDEKIEYSRRLQSFIDDQAWKKKQKR